MNQNDVRARCGYAGEGCTSYQDRL